MPKKNRQTGLIASGIRRLFNTRIYPALSHREEGDSDALELMGQGGYGGSPLADKRMRDIATNAAGGSETAKVDTQLPIDRILRYAEFERMSADPTISNALEMHVTNALTPQTETGEIVSIESTGDEDNPIAKDLAATLKPLMNKTCHSAAYTAAKLGVAYNRVYVKDKMGVHSIRGSEDFYTHPRFMKEYEKGGELIGYTNAYQFDVLHQGGIKLIEPWKFVPVKIPFWSVASLQEPIRTDWDRFDITADDPFAENIVETSNYGKSFLESAYEPWLDLRDAIKSIRMSRSNASRREMFTKVKTGNLGPKMAGEYLNEVSKRMITAQKDFGKRMLQEGYLELVINHLLPVWGEKGDVDIQNVEGKPDIAHIEDIMFHVKRLGGALGVDPSLLGFGDTLSGGLGDGGFFRLSVLAANRSNLIRFAVKESLEETAMIHVASKQGKFFLPGERPWKFVFHAISSALEAETRSNMESRVNFATLLVTLAQAMDPNADKFGDGFTNYVFTEVCQIAESQFRDFLSKGGKPNPDNVDLDNPDPELEEILESADTKDLLKLLLSQKNKPREKTYHDTI